jgi:hypothetical protein
MVEVAAHLTDHVLPALPVRPFLHDAAALAGEGDEAQRTRRSGR